MSCSYFYRPFNVLSFPVMSFRFPFICFHVPVMFPSLGWNISRVTLKQVWYLIRPKEITVYNFQALRPSNIEHRMLPQHPSLNTPKHSFQFPCIFCVFILLSSLLISFLFLSCSYRLPFSSLHVAWMLLRDPPLNFPLRAHSMLVVRYLPCAHCMLGVKNTTFSIKKSRS